MIRYANAADRKQIRELWEVCFPDESGFNDYFFQHLFCLENVLLIENNGIIEAMTQMIPRRLQSADGVTEECTYIYGACTHPAHRRKHLMSQLLERSFALDRSLGRKASVLIPAEQWLFDFYRIFDYQPSFMLGIQEKNVLPSRNAELSMLSSSDAEEMNALYKSCIPEETPYLMRDKSEWGRQIAMFSELGLGCWGKRASDGTLEAYAFAWKPDEHTVFIQEIAARSSEVLISVLEDIAALANVNKVRYSDLTCLTDRFGCMKRYDDQKVSLAIMNLMMN